MSEELAYGVAELRRNFSKGPVEAPDTGLIVKGGDAVPVDAVEDEEDWCGFFDRKGAGEEEVTDALCDVGDVVLDVTVLDVVIAE